eukprot:TRINITY_DN1474_c0_g3_i2.p1 TRINITY_DN1474_c0_g3~~TRINITY_DN1474_c0_g3_i2.p1  ORF type:complete len:199 (+),score=9.44 TRINITY_DN1474_c0_g3_i2:187-783(+)
MFILDIEMAKSLSLVSRLVSNTVKYYIEDKFYFSISKVAKGFMVYKPKCLKNVFVIDQITESIRRVKFGYGFNDVRLSHFTNITHMEVNWQFNYPIKNRLPPNLTHLRFSIHFNQPVLNLPNKLTHLHFGFDFNQSIERLPHKITHLGLGVKFEQPGHSLPPRIEQLEFHYKPRNYEELRERFPYVTITYHYNHSYYR